MNMSKEIGELISGHNLRLLLRKGKKVVSGSEQQQTKLSFKTKTILTIKPLKIVYRVKKESEKPQINFCSPSAFVRLFGRGLHATLCFCLGSSDEGLHLQQLFRTV